MDLILGDRKLREGLEQGEALVDLEKKWQPELARFEKQRMKYLLYDA